MPASCPNHALTAEQHCEELESMLRHVPGDMLEGDGDSPADAIRRLRKAYDERECDDCDEPSLGWYCGKCQHENLIAREKNIIEMCAKEAERAIVEYSKVDVLDATPEKDRIARRIRALAHRFEHRTETAVTSTTSTESEK